MSLILWFKEKYPDTIIKYAIRHGNIKEKKLKDINFIFRQDKIALDAFIHLEEFNEDTTLRLFDINSTDFETFKDHVEYHSLSIGKRNKGNIRNIIIDTILLKMHQKMMHANKYEAGCDICDSGDIEYNQKFVDEFMQNNKK